MPAVEPSAERWAAVADTVRDRMRQLNVTTAWLARETGHSETTICYLGQTGGGNNKSTLVAISAVLRWRYNHLTNILNGQSHKNSQASHPLAAVVHAEMASVMDDLADLKVLVQGIAEKMRTDLASGSSLGGVGRVILGSRAGPGCPLVFIRIRLGDQPPFD